MPTLRGWEAAAENLVASGRALESVAPNVAAATCERYQRRRLDKGKALATVTREVHALRRALRVAAWQTPALFPRHLVAYLPSLPVDNVRGGFFEPAGVDALLEREEDEGIRDFIAQAFPTGHGEGRDCAAQLGHARPRLRKVAEPESPGGGSSGRIRTYNPPVNSRMLYH